MAMILCRKIRSRVPIVRSLLPAAILFLPNPPGVAADSKITHSFLALGTETFIVSDSGKTEWTYPFGTRDGWVLPNGNLLLTLSKCDKYPGGAVVEITRSGQTLFEFKGTQSEVNTSQKLASGNVLLTEAGPHPRILEVDSNGTIIVNVPLTCQTTNYHLQTRMTRKLANGNYLVPQLLDKVVREYTSDGKIAWEAATPHWAFTAIRLPDGHTLINCTTGNLVIEVDAQGKTTWQLSNEHLPNALINDACGGQRLPNGNTVFSSYRIGADRTKLIEVTPDKKVVWTYTDPRKDGIHEFQILDTNGQPLTEPVLR